MDAVLLERQAAIAKAKLEGKNAAETELLIKLATIDADQKITDIFNNRQKQQAQIEKQFEKTLSGLDLQLEQVQAISGEQKDAIEVKRIELSYLERGKQLTADERAELLKKVQDIRLANEALEEQQFIQNNLNTLVNAAGQQFSGLFQTLIQGTNDWNAAISNVLNSLANALIKFGLSALGGNDGVGLFSILSGTFSGGKALGGQVNPGKTYMVGEKGPELFSPGAKGNIIPNNAMGGSNIVVNVDAGGSNVQGDGTQAKALGAAIGLAVQNEIIKQKKPGGLLY